jgi:DNA-binding NarL/FixJ family response regulator
MTKNTHTKILILDEQPLHNMGLSSLLQNYDNFNIVGITTNFSDALKIAEKEKPNLIILEIYLNKENNLDFITKIKKINPQTIILVLSANDERFYSERVLRLGARGYVMKTSDINTIMDAINTVLEGKVYLSENERERLFQAMTGDSTIGSKDWTMSLQKLSNRELQIFTLIGKGYGTIEIASRFNISTKTIDSHKEHLKLKLHCSTTQELRQLAIEWVNKTHSFN